MSCVVLVLLQSLDIQGAVVAAADLDSEGRMFETTGTDVHQAWHCSLTPLPRRLA